jgi:hypothetical protein
MSWFSRPGRPALSEAFETAKLTIQQANDGLRVATEEIARLQINNEGLRSLLIAALYHVESEGDDTLSTMIRAALRQGDEEFQGGGDATCERPRKL